jgi:hypothetical protein
MLSQYILQLMLAARADGTDFWVALEEASEEYDRIVAKENES